MENKNSLASKIKYFGKDFEIDEEEIGKEVKKFFIKEDFKGMKDLFDAFYDYYLSVKEEDFGIIFYEAQEKLDKLIHNFDRISNKLPDGEIGPLQKFYRAGVNYPKRWNRTNCN